MEVRACHELWTWRFNSLRLPRTLELELMKLELTGARAFETIELPGARAIETRAIPGA